MYRCCRTRSAAGGLEDSRSNKGTAAAAAADAIKSFIRLPSVAFIVGSYKKREQRGGELDTEYLSRLMGRKETSKTLQRTDLSVGTRCVVHSELQHAHRTHRSTGIA